MYCHRLCYVLPQTLWYVNYHIVMCCHIRFGVLPQTLWCVTTLCYDCVATYFVVSYHRLCRALLQTLWCVCTDALLHGLVSKVVPEDKLEEEVGHLKLLVWCAKFFFFLWLLWECTVKILVVVVAFVFVAAAIVCLFFFFSLFFLLFFGGGGGGVHSPFAPTGVFCLFNFFVHSSI